jgi:hypothetical protein
LIITHYISILQLCEMSHTTGTFSVLMPFYSYDELFSIMGQASQYVLVEPVGISSHIEEPGLSVILYTPIAREIETVWQGWRGPGRFSKKRMIRCRIDPAWSELHREAVEFAFATYETVWLALGDGVIWLRAWCGTPGAVWCDLDVTLGVSRFPICPGPRESAGSWLREAGSDANEIASGKGLPPLHLMELAGFISCRGLGITVVETTVGSSNWSYNVGGEDFLSWQNVPDASTLVTAATFELPIGIAKLISMLEGWAFGVGCGGNPLICSVALRAEGLLRLRSIRDDTPHKGCRAIDLLISI